MLSVRQGDIKYHFLSLWYDSIWDLNLGLPSKWWTLELLAQYIYYILYIYEDHLGNTVYRNQRVMASCRSQNTVSSTFFTDSCTRKVFFIKRVIFSAPWVSFLPRLKVASRVSQFVNIFCTKICFSIHSTHSSVNCIWFALLSYLFYFVSWHINLLGSFNAKFHSSRRTVVILFSS